MCRDFRNMREGHLDSATQGFGGRCDRDGGRGHSRPTQLRAVARGA